MRRLRYDLSAAVGGVQWCWHVEPNPAGTGHHVHYFAKGAFIPQAVLSSKADGVGMGKVATVQRWAAPDLRAAGYGLKLAGAGYGLKGTQGAAQFDGYLRCNGGRLVHTSRQWWQDEHGRPTSYDGAMAAWLRLSRPADRGAWQLVHDGDPLLRGVQALDAMRNDSQSVSKALQAVRAIWEEPAPSGGYDSAGRPLTEREAAASSGWALPRAPQSVQQRATEPNTPPDNQPNTLPDMEPSTEPNTGPRSGRKT